MSHIEESGVVLPHLDAREPRRYELSLTSMTIPIRRDKSFADLETYSVPHPEERDVIAYEVLRDSLDDGIDVIDILYIRV
jgi:hypothetical protein